MIPKIIHYCWFSGEKYPPQIKRCIQSWKQQLPGYEFILWDGNRFDFNSVPFVKKCIEMRKWAFAADYIRLYAVYTQGGIYLDSDVMVLRPFDGILDCNAFWGIDANDGQHYAFPEAAIFGSVKGLEPLRDMMSYYEKLPVSEIAPATFERLTNVFTPQNRSIFDKEGNLHLVTAPTVMESVLSEYGYKQENINQVLENDIHIYGQPIFLNGILEDQDETIAHHQNASSWFFTDRGPLFKFCYNHPGLMRYYTKLEQFRKQLHV